MNPLTSALWERRPQHSLRIVDAHAHAGPYSLFFIPEAGPAAMVRVMDRCGVSHAVLSSHLAIQLDAAAGNAATAEVVGHAPGRFTGYLTVNPWQDPVGEIEKWGADPRFGGVKLHPDLHVYPLTGPRYAPVWEFAQRTGCPVLTHTYDGSPYNDLPMVEEMAVRYPGAVILAGHAGATPLGFDAAIGVAQRRPGVVLEVCGSYNTGADLARMVREVGPRQVVFGSDFPFIDLRMSLGRVLFSDLSDDARAAVLGGTMTDLLQWRDNARRARSSQVTAP
ncbi:amidohydrolase family protein [Streptosporangium minutum]|uniref:Metal-dependent hydrolase n=1 Tax=Streptosporangium minutum TaxID=569862 RepID=A0A243RL64_9ACTN|nr:amidohydrolase family protein [Streptosporangium minutum]OUC95639.1 metal-dependent hydrolase [Streptosporangium minutum]